jgi:hypothetical protein
MMRTRIRAVAAAVTLTVAIAVAGCGADDPAGDDAASSEDSLVDFAPESEAPEIEAPETDAPETEAPAPDGDTAENPGLAFAECMRENGVEDFPDPRADAGGSMAIDKELAEDPDFQAAFETCGSAQRGQPAPGPDGGAGNVLDPEAALEMAKCMRDNGVEDFPDPEPRGDGASGGQGLDPSIQEDPEFEAAMESCSELFAPDGQEDQ